MDRPEDFLLCDAPVDPTEYYVKVFDNGLGVGLYRLAETPVDVDRCRDVASDFFPRRHVVVYWLNDEGGHDVVYVAAGTVVVRPTAATVAAVYDDELENLAQRVFDVVVFDGHASRLCRMKVRRAGGAMRVDRLQEA